MTILDRKKFMYLMTDLLFWFNIKRLNWIVFQEMDGQTFRTNTEYHTLSPKWNNQNAKFAIEDIRLKKKIEKS
jgi:hypothetical protein